MSKNLDLRSADAGCTIDKSSGPQNPRVHIVLKTSKSSGAKGDVPKIYRFLLTHSLIKIILRFPTS